MSLSELFPTRSSLTIFVSYISLFIGQGILVTASQTGGHHYAYNTSEVVLYTEILKLCMSVGLYLRTNSIRSLATSMRQSTDLLKLYMVPSILYCVYNNLAFVNLLKFDPTTYYLLLQFRVVITGVIFQIVFRKILTLGQWMSLILLTCGCIVNRLDFSAVFGSDLADADSRPALKLHPFMLLILLQAVCSCLAGVYNEYILKHQGADVNIYVQNAYMYIDSILINLLVLYYADIGGGMGTTANADSDADGTAATGSIWSLSVILVMVNNACIGIVTSYFLKYLNSILKTFASALELLATAVLCYILFGIAITINTVLSIALVSLAIYLYTCAPVNNDEKDGARHQHDKTALLNEKDLGEVDV